MNIVARAVWRLKGEAATVIEDEYEDTISALVYPSLALSLLAASAIGVRGLLTVGGGVQLAAAAVLAGMTLLFAWMFLSASIASIWYYREQTTAPLAREVNS